MELRKPISVEEALERVHTYAPKGTIEVVEIEKCLGRYLGEDIIADTNVPPFDKAPYDGFAVRSEDTIGVTSADRKVLEVIDHIGAGKVSQKELGVNQAVRIMTGAQIPVGCDAVMMLELIKEIDRDGKPFIEIKRELKHGENISYQGEDISVGSTLVHKGTSINPGTLALLATFGYDRVKVMKKPVVGVFATGNELLDVNEPLQPGKIRNSNAYMLCAQVERSGAEVRYLGKLADTFEDTYESIKKALDEVDILITTGGVSVGDFDFIPKAYAQLGVDVLFNKIAMRPGSVTTVGQLNGKLLFGLSGNPSACYVGFELYARPIIRKMFGSEKPYLKQVKAILDEDFKKANPFTRFVRSKINYRDAKIYVAPVGKDKSNIICSLAFSDCLMILPGGTRGFEKGMEVNLLLLEDQEGSETF